MSKYKNLTWRITDLLKDLKRLPSIITGNQLSLRVMDKVHESGLAIYHGGFLLQDNYSGYYLAPSLNSGMENSIARYNSKGELISET